MCCCNSTSRSTSQSGPSSSSPPNCVGERCEPTCRLVSLTVIRNATQTNVTGAKNWACVRRATDDVIVQATTTPDNEACWRRINWSGDTGSDVPGHPNQRRLSRAAARHYHVEAELGGVRDHVDVWVLWADLVVTIGTTDTIDTGNDASGLAAGHNWPAMLGGGNRLGPMTSEGTALTYAYTVGKMQARATLTPPGIEDVVRRSWHMKRRVDVKAWDNGVSSFSQMGRPDVSAPAFVDEDPKSGTSTREIYDVDAPGCSIGMPGTSINHTAEVYDNFTQFVTVTLDAEVQCSDDRLWSYTAWVDVDRASGKVEKNELRLSHIALPASSHYPTR
jgi:hypothetical protein